MKKGIVVAYLLTLCLAATACGAGNNAGNTAESSTESTQDNFQNSTEESITQNETQDSTQSTPQDNPNDEVTSGWSSEMQAVRDAVAGELGGDYWPTMGVTPDILESLYGISPDMYEDYVAEMPMISVQIDTLVVVKPAEGQEDAVYDAFSNYRESLIQDGMQYPMNVGKIHASAVEKVGGYVCFVMLGGDVSGVAQNGDEAIIEHCQAQNTRAIEALKQQIGE